MIEVGSLVKLKRDYIPVERGVKFKVIRLNEDGTADLGRVEVEDVHGIKTGARYVKPVDWLKEV